MKKISEDEEYSPGWLAIDDAFEELYREQKPEHFVTYGMTVLYGDEEAFGGELNGWGYEMTIKLKEANTEVKTQTSVYGKTEFMQLVGITELELKAIIEDSNNIPKLLVLMRDDGNEHLVTDMGRTKSYISE